MNLKNTIRNTFENLFENDDYFFIEIVECMDSQKDWLEDSRYYDMNSFDDIMANYTPSEIIELFEDSPHFNVNDDYFRIYPQALYSKQKVIESYDYKDYSFIDRDVLFDDMFYSIKNDRFFLEELIDCIKYYPYSYYYTRDYKQHFSEVTQPLIDNILEYSKQPKKATA